LGNFGEFIVIRLSRARLAQFIAALAVLISALALSSGSAQAASLNGAFTNIKVTAASGSGLIYPWEQIRVTADWSVPDQTPAATTFSLAWPAAQLSGIGGTLALKNTAGNTVATCTLGKASLDCTLTSFVTTHPYNIKGSVWFTLTQVNIPENSTVSIPFTSGTTKTFVRYPTTGSVPNSFTGIDYYKDVWVHDGTVTWYIYLPGGKTGQTEDYNNVVVEDTLGGNQTFLPGTFSLEHATKLNSAGTWPNWQTAAKSLYTVTANASNSFTFNAKMLAKGGWWRLVYDVKVDTGYKGQISNTAKTSWDTHQQISTTHTEVYLEAGGVGQGEIHAVSVGDTVWWDKNRDGLQNDGPGTGIADAVLTLTGGDGKPVTDVFGKVVAPITTGATGVYLFQNLPPLAAGKHYTVTVTPPAGYTPTLAGVGNDRAIDSSTGSATSTDLVADGAQDVTLDFGFVKGAVSVGDLVWLDVNRDGLQTTGEPGIPGVTVNLLQNGKVIATTTTDASGYYGFDNLDPSTAYTVQFVVPTGKTVTTKDAGGDASNSPTTDLTDSDAAADGLVPFTTPADGVNSVAPRKADNPGIDLGLVTQINLTLAKTVLTLGPVRNGAELTYTLTPHNDGPVAALAGWSVTDVLPAGMTLVSISGDGYTCDATTDPTKPVCVAGAGLGAGAGGAVVTVVTKVTIDSGNLKNVAYVSPAKGDVPETNPLVVPALTTDTSTSATDNDAQANIDVASPVSVGDYAWWDVNRDGVQSEGEPSIPNVTVTLLDSEGAVLATTTTDAKGYYAFPGLTPGQMYTVVFTPPSGATLTTQNAGSNDAIDSDPAADGKVTFTAPATGANLTDPTSADLPRIDAGFVRLNLTLTKSVTSSGPYYGGANVTYTLVPHNDGPVNALAGWSVTEVMPPGSTLVGLSGDGYTCYTNLVCISSTTLAAGADAKPITVVVQIPADLTGQFKNVAYVSPAENETTETNPLVVPTIDTDTVASTTDNDAEAVIDVLPPEPEGIVITLPNTGTTIPLTWLLGAIGIVAAGVILLGASRFNARGRKG
jgi:uncharacterized repeat protein (TIGR01451 family)